MKICFFPHYSISNRDGAMLSMYNIIDEMVNRGIEVVVILPNTNHLEKRLKSPGVTFYHVPMYSMRMAVSKMTRLTKYKFFVKYIHNQQCIKKIVNKLKHENIDYIHINGLDSSVGAKVAKRLNVPYIWHIRAFLGEDLGKKLFMQEETYALAKNASSVIGISKDIQKKFEKVLGRSVDVVYNGIPLEEYDIPDHKILENDDVHILLAGRISIQKGQMIAIKAIEKLVQGGCDNVYLTLIGQGETQEYLREIHDYIKRNELEKYVSILEASDNLRGLRKTHDIGLICSQKEAFGRVTVENMMAGMLAIGANSGGTPEIITDGVDGLLYTVDDVDSLTQQIKYAITNREKMGEIAQRGYQCAIEKYSIVRVVDDLLEIYNR